VPAAHRQYHYVHHPMGSAQQAQQAEIRRILRSTDAQAKLTVGQPNDKYEQEADSVADQVMAMPDPKLQRQPENEEEEETLQTKSLADQITPLVQRQEEPPEEEEEPVQAKFKDGAMLQRQRETNCPECKEDTAQRQPMEEEEEELQAKEQPGETPQVDSGVESRINSLKGGGQPLDPATRSYFEPCFGHDFSHVRVHADSNASEAAKSVNARALTLGNNLVFGSVGYQPQSMEGKRLLGHELTHVVQQSKSRQALQRSSLVQRAPPVDAAQPLKLIAAREPIARDFGGAITATIFFGQALSLLDRPNAEAVEGIGLLLSFLPGAQVSVHGHASTEGGPIFNQRLSERRTNTVVALLQAHSFGALSISEDASGEMKPLMKETGSGDALEQKRQWNRRVEIVVIKSPAPPIELLPPGVIGPKDENGRDNDTGGERPPDAPSTYKELEDRFNKLRNNPFVKQFVAPSLEESFEQGRPTLKFRWEF